MTLYSADIADLAKPVTKPESKKRKTQEASPASSDLPPAPAMEPEKKKRVLSEKQKEALKAGQEKRRLKQLEQEKQKQEQASKEQQLAEEKEAKKAAAKEKRALKRKQKEEDTLTQEIDTAVQEVVTEKQEAPPKIKKVKTKPTQEDPPPWFRKYIEGVKQEQAQSKKEKTPKKQIQQEAQEEAKTKWGDGLVRDRLRNEVDGHMNRMYGMIFGGRGMR